MFLENLDPELYNGAKMEVTFILYSTKFSGQVQELEKCDTDNDKHWLCTKLMKRFENFCDDDASKVACKQTCDLCKGPPAPPPPPPPPPPVPEPKCGVSKVSQSRVVNGEDAPEGAYPWIASLQVRVAATNTKSHFCGGTLIHPKWVRTKSKKKLFFFKTKSFQIHVYLPSRITKVCKSITSPCQRPIFRAN